MQAPEVVAATTPTLPARLAQLAAVGARLRAGDRSRVINARPFRAAINPPGTLSASTAQITGAGPTAPVTPVTERSRTAAVHAWRGHCGVPRSMMSATQPFHVRGPVISRVAVPVVPIYGRGVAADDLTNHPLQRVQPTSFPVTLAHRNPRYNIMRRPNDCFQPLRPKGELRSDGEPACLLHSSPEMERPSSA